MVGGMFDIAILAKVVFTPLALGVASLAHMYRQRGLVIPAEISVYEDRTFTFVTKTPPTPFLLRQAAGIEKGAANPRTDKAGKVTSVTYEYGNTFTAVAGLLNILVILDALDTARGHKG